jgi:hypothetical protein
MTTIPLTAALALLLAACATDIQDDTSGQASAPSSGISGVPSGGIRTQSYIPGGQSAPARASAQDRREDQARNQDDDPSQIRQVPRRRVGSSSPPPDSAAPRMAIPNLPPPPSTAEAVNDAKRDLMIPELDRMREAQQFNPTDPLLERDILNKQYDLNQIGRDTINR